MESLHSISHKFFLVLLTALLLTSCRPSLASSLSPTSTPSVYEVSTVTSSLEKACGVKFKEEKKDGAITSMSGVDEMSLLHFSFVSNSNNLTQAKVIVSGLDNSSGWMGYESYVHDCMLAMLQPMGLEALLVWYKEQLKVPSAEVEVANVHASTKEEGQYIRSLTLAFGASGPRSSVEGTTTGAQADCGQGTIGGLGGTRLNIRKNPGLDQGIIGKAHEGDIVQLSCEEQGKDGIVWVKITTQDNGQSITGWVSKEYITAK